MLVFGVAFLLVALRMPLQTALGPGPGFLPVLIGVLIVGSSSVALATGASNVAPGTPFPMGEEARRVPVLLGLMLAYLLLLLPVGHLIAATLLSCGTLWMLGRRPWWAALGIGVSFSTGSWALFALAMGVPLPAGPLG